MKILSSNWERRWKDGWMARVERPTCFFYVSASLFLEFQWCSRIGPPLYVEKERKMEMVLCRERKRDKGTSILFYGLHDIKLNGLLLYREKKNCQWTNCCLVSQTYFSDPSEHCLLSIWQQNLTNKWTSPISRLLFSFFLLPTGVWRIQQ